MSLEQYQARADALVGSADVSVSEDMILEREATSAKWREMADLAHVHDVFQAALAAQDALSE